MAETFKAIETQEAFDAAIKDRLERERAKFQTEIDKAAGLQQTIDKLQSEKATWETEKGGLEAQIQDLTGKLSAADGRVKAAELETKKLEVVLAAGLPAELRTRIQGSTEKELQEDAAKLADLFKNQKPSGMPGVSSETRRSKDDGALAKDDAFKQMLESIKK